MRQSNLTIHLEEKFEDWNESKQTWLIEKLVQLAGCTVEEVTFARARPGCVLLYLLIPEAAAKRLEAEYKTGLKPPTDSNEVSNAIQISLVKEIHEKFNIVSVRADILAASTYIATTPKVERPLFVLVHGWRGSRDSFGKLPEILESEFNCEVAIPEYKSNFVEGADPLYLLGGQLTTFVNNRSFRTPRSVVLIGHSMGGVISRASLVESLRDRNHYVRQTKLVVTVASPLGGSWLGNLANYIPAKFGAMRQAVELSTNSATLAQINQWWHHWVGENRHLEACIRSVYSPADNVVPINSAIGDDPNAICIPNLSHTEIVKPASSADEFALSIIRLASQAGIYYSSDHSVEK